MKYLESLNTEQREAVLTTFGPVCIVAGAGAGKTKTITYRILHLITEGVKPENILAVTFTNKAANEMKERITELLKEKFLGNVWISTFHSLGVRIIKENAPLLNLPKHFTIFDKSDSKKIVKWALLELGFDPKEHADKIAHIISKEKGSGVSFSSFEKKVSESPATARITNVWRLYEQRLSKEKALDFDDLLLKALELLRKHKEILENYQDKFQYIHVDEYQDTNSVQNEIMELLALKHQNICVVGDTDQNIYSWRGAEIKNMLHFERRYPSVKIIFLEQNYRSTKNILSAANEVISKNTFRIPKKLFTENSDGEKIGLFMAKSEINEANFIALTSKELVESGVVPEEIAVLYRANFQSRVLEEAFVSLAVPYQMLGTKFFERKEVKDVLSYIKSSLNENSLSDFFRAMSVPPRGIGKTSIQKILAGKENELPEKTRIKVENFRILIQSFKTILLSFAPSEAVKHIIKTSGLEDSFNLKNEEDVERLENVMELVSLAKNYDSYQAGEAIEKFLSDSSLASSDDEIDQGKNGVKLLTVHSSKGLEFDYVFIAGLEDGLFPHQNHSLTRKTGEEAEEERRLFYVALTRARKKIFLSFAQSRTIFGSKEMSAPSEFINDIPNQYLEYVSYPDSEPKREFANIEF